MPSLGHDSMFLTVTVPLWCYHSNYCSPRCSSLPSVIHPHHKCQFNIPQAHLCSNHFPVQKCLMISYFLLNRTHISYPSMRSHGVRHLHIPAVAWLSGLSSLLHYPGNIKIKEANAQAPLQKIISEFGGKGLDLGITFFFF